MSWRSIAMCRDIWGTNIDIWGTNIDIWGNNIDIWGNNIDILDIFQFINTIFYFVDKNKIIYSSVLKLSILIIFVDILTI